jgi:hypothetical protein
MKKKVKRYQEGGVTVNQQAPAQMELPGLAGYGAPTNSYPFQSSGSAPSATDTSSGSGVNQTFNIQPTAQSGQPGTTTMKRGGKVSSASRRGDGCAIRGKTRA